MLEVVLARRRYQKEWRKKNYDKVLASRIKTRRKLRKDVLNAYGNKCMCCGETEQKFLTIDHIYNDGAEHRRSLNIRSAEKLYCWLRKNNYPKDRFQLLCFNCNCAKQYYGKCPHKEKVCLK